MVKEFALWGIALNVAGVLGLFYFGMPFKIPTRGALLIGTEPRPGALMWERIYGILGKLALLAVLSGAALQAYAVWQTP
ncbi:hypothetical protein [Pelagibacterium lacus]|nr:hypothetical protein [Pelagibacterium lacus]